MQSILKRLRLDDHSEMGLLKRIVGDFPLIQTLIGIRMLASVRIDYYPIDRRNVCESLHRVIERICSTKEHHLHFHCGLGSQPSTQSRIYVFCDQSNQSNISMLLCRIIDWWFINNLQMGNQFKIVQNAIRVWFPIQRRITRHDAVNEVRNTKSHTLTHCTRTSHIIDHTSSTS